MKITKREDIPSDWKVLKVRKKSMVSIRPSNGVERFKVSWSTDDLVSDPELDYIVISSEGSEYPCKKTIFDDTYVQVIGSLRYFVKKYVSEIVEIPEGYTLSVVTLEGEVGDVKHPDYIAIGPVGEVYVNCKDFVDKHLEIVN